MWCGCYEIISERQILVLLAEKSGDVVPMTFKRIMQTSPPTFVNASLSLIVPLCYLMHGFRRWKEMRQHQNTNNKVVDNEKGGGRHNKYCLGLLCLAQPKGSGANERERLKERERISQASFLVFSQKWEEQRERKSFELNLSVTQRSGPCLEITTALPFVPAADVSIRKINWVRNTAYLF